MSLGISLIGCVNEDGEDKPAVSDVKGGADGKAEAWGSQDSPLLFNQNLELNASALPMTGEARNIPWASSYWPIYQDNINVKWDGASSKPASTKYGQAFGVTGVEDAVSKNHGIDAQGSAKACTADSECKADLGEACAKRDGQTAGKCIPTWFGICHAWAPVAILLPEPKKPVTHNGVEFKINDIKALLTLVHDRTESRFVSLRCDQLDVSKEINFDKYGRPTGASAGCKDTNPGTFHVLMTNYLGKQGESFVYDRTWDGEVWNQPLRGYRITSSTEISALDANKAIGVVAEGGVTSEKTGTVTGGATTQLGSVAVTPGSNFTIVMSGDGDPDMYVKFGGEPTTGSYDCRPYETGPAETCTLTVPAGATQAFISVAGYGTTPSNFKMSITSGGSIPTNYVFNANAKKLMKTHMDVDYISESSATTDGNLGSQINRYTHQDNYDYILELDANGKIIGGEWIGASKRQHPDFVWLPIRSTVTTVAGGKISYANVKMIYDLSMQDGSGGGTGTVKTVNDTAVLAKAAWKNYGPFKVAAGATLTATLEGDGDADLYVRKGSAPTAATYDCRPYRDGSSEACTVTGGGDVYVGVNGYAASSNITLKITYTEGGGVTPPPPPPPTNVLHVNTTGSVTQGEMKIFTVDVIANRRIVLRTTSTKDVDLYVQMGTAPTTNAYLQRAFTSSGNETITMTPTSSGKLFIGVHGYEAASFSVRSADQ